MKSSRVTMIWAVPFCAGLALFAPDLVEHVLGSEWEPAVLLIQGLAGAAALQQVGYGWFSFYRARGDSRPQAVESAVMAGAFLGLAVPGLFLYGVEGFIAGRVATSLAMLVVRRRYVRRLFGGRRAWRAGPARVRSVVAATGATLALRELLDSGTLPELALFAAVAAALTWAFERRLLGELAAYARGRAAGADPRGLQRGAVPPLITSAASA